MESPKEIIKEGYDKHMKNVYKLYLEALICQDYTLEAWQEIGEENRVEVVEKMLLEIEERNKGT